MSGKRDGDRQPASEQQPLAPEYIAKYATFGLGSPRLSGFEGSDVHPQDAASWLSRTLLTWITPLMTVGHTKQLDASDLWPLRRQHQAEFNATSFTRDFDQNRSILKSFFQSFGWRFALTGVGFLISMLCNLVGPMVLKQVVGALTNQHFALDAVSRWVLLLFVAQVVQAMVDNLANFESEIIAIQFVGSLKSLLYNKTLKLNAASRKKKSTGEITNMFTADSDAILQAAYLVHQAWLIPLQIIVVSFLLYDVLGVAAFAGIGVIIVLLILNNRVSSRMFRLQRIYRSSKDKRMKRVTEVFKAINVLKLNAWEDKFMEKIEETRTTEMTNLFRMRLNASISIMLLWGMPAFISIASFGVYAAVLKQDLSPAIVFTSISLFQLIQGPLRQITNIIISLIQSQVALERVSKFLGMPEINPHNVQSIDSDVADTYIVKNVIISIEHGSFGWSASPSPDVQATLLNDVNWEVKAGEFHVVHGPVGCGKSSLCAVLLGDMVKYSGSVYVGGSIAYCAQQPWIQNMTVRDNILFGLPFDRKKYDKIVDACALTSDLQSLPAGDMTEIGERGINLSGGQKARVALARACYSDASVYVLDSPLSAVDAIVQNEIFQKCLLGLLRDKTIILVTHNPEIIASPHTTHAYTITANGNVVETHQVQTRPSYEPMVSPLASRVYVRPNVFGDTHSSQNDELAREKKRPVLNGDDANADEQAEEVPMVSPFRRDRVKSFNADGLVDKDDVEAADRRRLETGRLIKDEVRTDGRVQNRVFSAYYNALGGFPIVTLIILPQMIGQALQVSGDFWLGSWSSDSLSGSTITTETRLEVYSILGVTGALMVLARMVIIAVFGVRAARRLFDKMTHALMHAPMRFFDANPIGRILTRYGGDVSAVDAMLPFLFARSIASLLGVTTSTLTAAIVIQWKGLLLIPVAILYFHIGAFYIRPARELQRLTRTTQAPVLNHLSESVDGGTVLRAFGSQHVERFRQTNYGRLDEANKVRFAQLAVSQWFSLRIQLVGTLLVMVVTSSLIMLRDQLGAAVIGLAFSYALKVSQNLEMIVQLVSRVETAMVSPERMQEYIEIPQEAPARLPLSDPPVLSKWPAVGSVHFDHVSFRYKEHDRLVLKELTFAIEGGQKIGIVGRTGAGKSSLTMALFRINELACGTITIDGINISTIGLKTLREKLSIIPQNPVLFKGPLRTYLDPFSAFTDDELWRSISRVGLMERITNEQQKLDCAVEENGENFSVGERQMLCMARALLRQSRIVIFDEATAAIDHGTDQKLQRVIREAFAESTVITIAHRLDTILDSDMILVLEAGEMVEFASPAALVTKGNGHFFELMQEGGYLDKFLAQPTTY